MSINSNLEELAKEAIIRENEREGINRSVKTIIERLEEYFHIIGITIDNPLIFGSYKRKTIIPRKLDENSDIDILVIFGGRYKNFIHYGNPQFKPCRYLEHLKSFARQYYPQSNTYQDFPSVVLELNHIKFDLVPAIHNFYGGYKIPSKPINGFYFLQDWIDTDPNDLDGALANNQTLRRLVRLAKIWNAKSDYIYPSYELEKWIVEQVFWGNLEEYFFRFCEMLPISWEHSQAKQSKIDRLKQSARNAQKSKSWDDLKNIFE